MGFSLARAYSYKQIVYIHNNSITIYIILLTSYNIRRRRQQKTFRISIFFFENDEAFREKTKPDLVKTKPGEIQNLKASLDHAALPLLGKPKQSKMKENYESIAALIQSGASVKIHADKFSVQNLRLLAQMAAKHNVQLGLLVNPDSILLESLNLIAQDGSKHLTIEFI